MKTISEEVKVNQKAFRYFNINGVITAIPVNEIDKDLLDELFDR